MADKNDGNGNENGNQDTDQGNETQTWEAFLGAQSDDVKALHEGHVKGLRSALGSERDQRKDLASQLQDAAKKLEKGSEAQKALEEASGKLEAANQRADFYAEASKPEIGCSNAKLAYIAAQEIGAFDSRGNVNWEVLKQQFPELFKGKPVAKGNAGSGAGQTGGGKAGMNEFIRAAAGR